MLPDFQSSSQLHPLVIYLNSINMLLRDLKNKFRRRRLGGILKINIYSCSKGEECAMGTHVIWVYNKQSHLKPLCHYPGNRLIQFI